MSTTITDGGYEYDLLENGWKYNPQLALAKVHGIVGYYRHNGCASIESHEDRTDIHEMFQFLELFIREYGAMVTYNIPMNVHVPYNSCESVGSYRSSSLAPMFEMIDDLYYSYHCRMGICWGWDKPMKNFSYKLALCHYRSMEQKQKDIRTNRDRAFADLRDLRNSLRW